MGKKLDPLFKDKIFEDADSLNDYYEEITDTEREIMSYLDHADIQMVKPEERKSLYFQDKKKTPTLLLPIKVSPLFRRRL